MITLTPLTVFTFTICLKFHDVIISHPASIYEVYISDIVIREISGCNEEKLKILLGYLKQIDYNIVETDEDTIELAGKFIDFGILKQKSFDDCQHIAAAIFRITSSPYQNKVYHNFSVYSTILFITRTL